jgi:hypothetical protein
MRQTMTMRATRPGLTLRAFALFLLTGVGCEADAQTADESRARAIAVGAAVLRSQVAQMQEAMIGHTLSVTVCYWRRGGPDHLADCFDIAEPMARALVAGGIEIGRDILRDHQRPPKPPARKPARPTS